MRINKTAEMCCGCTACAAKCPHEAITMLPDSLGFFYPHIDDSKCIDCGLCEVTCDFKPDYHRTGYFERPRVFGGRLKDGDELSISQSGGAAFALTNHMIENGGVVYGAAFDANFMAVHKRCTTKSESAALRNSKYIQSDMRGVFPLVKKDLTRGLMVLFIGTPCQVAGLKSYVGKKLCEQLYTTDLICHGVASPKIWSNYIEYVERRSGDKIIVCKFRDKSFGWRSCTESFHFVHRKPYYNRIFRDLYFKHFITRESCFCCPYTNYDRVSDITIGDFWGWEKTQSKFNDNKGVSLFLVNTPKGEALFNQINTQINYIASNTAACEQEQLKHPTKPHPRRKDFIKNYESKGFKYVIKKYAIVGYKYNFNCVIKSTKRFIDIVKWHLHRK